MSVNNALEIMRQGGGFTIPSTAAATDQLTQKLGIQNTLDRLKATDATALQSQSDSAAMARTGLPLGILGDDPNRDTKVNELYKSLQIGRASDAISAQRGGGFKVQIPKGGLSILDAVQQPGGHTALKGEAAEIAKAKLAIKDEKKVVKKFKETPRGATMGLGDVTRTEGTSTTATSSGTPEAQKFVKARVLEQAKKRFPKAKSITGPHILGSKAFVLVDGEPIELNRK
jgi:hypothetical protein